MPNPDEDARLRCTSRPLARRAARAPGVVRRAVDSVPPPALSALGSLDRIKSWSRFAKASKQVAVTVYEAEKRPKEMARSIFVPASVEGLPAGFVPDLDHVTKDLKVVLTCQQQPRQVVRVPCGGCLVVERVLPGLAPLPIVFLVLIEDRKRRPGQGTRAFPPFSPGGHFRETLHRRLAVRRGLPVSPVVR